MTHTAEIVTAWHPDKICDQISDAILDECLKQDPMSRVAVETMGGHGKIFLTGEITTKAEVDYKKVAKGIYKGLLDKDIEVYSNIVSQCPEISKGVDKGGAGDQGVMIGYACSENEMKIPLEIYFARKLLEPFKADAKSQVTIENKKVTNIVLSVQGKTQKELQEYVGDFVAKVLPDNTMPNVYCNNTGSFVTGGFDADSGVTGRKIVVDAYGPRIPVGGGAFSGKDPTKVDRSGAYMARWLALNEIEYGAKEVLVKLAYVIGKSEPIMQVAIIDGKKFNLDEYDCRPEAIIERFDLRRPIYLQTARDGHFGIKSYPWEKV
jgi:S-adenosylmethionine synthetase